MLSGPRKQSGRRFGLRADVLLATAILLLLVLCPCAWSGGPPWFAPPIIRYHPEQDQDADGIDDLLFIGVDEAIRQSDQRAQSHVIVTLFVPASDHHLALFGAVGGELEHIYDYVTYGFSGTLPTAAIEGLAHALGEDLCVVEEAVPLEMFLEDSTRIIGARPTVWDAGYQGSSDTVVAVLDSGIDSSHTDLSGGKVIAWEDVTTSAEPSPVDYSGHGTHVSSILAGTGASIPAASLSSMTSLTLTFTGRLPFAVGYGWPDFIYVRSTGSLSQNMIFQGGGLGWLQYTTPGGTSYGRVSSSPVSQTGTLSTTGRYVTASGGYNVSAAEQPFSTLETYPYVPVADLYDGHNLFAGVAPGANLVGVKLFANSGAGTSADMTAAMDWIIANRSTYDIKVASMSVGLVYGTLMPTLRDKADSVVANGIVFVIAAGNDYPTYDMGDPALAPKVIAVGAVNDQSAVTSYSSNAPTGFAKPDVCAPGGSPDDLSGALVTAAETNNNDGRTYSGGTYPVMADRAANDYTNKYGTSMSCPHVSGLAALLVEAWQDQGHTWAHTEAEALKIKSLILMTAYETAVAGESENTPTTTRDGARDAVEGYGRVCADAAVEALTQQLTLPASESGTLGGGQFDKRVWARSVALTSGTPYSVGVDTPGTGDFDLYLYADGFTTSGDSHGDPILAALSSTNGSGVDESIEYTPATTGTYYVVVKWVSGSGAFGLTASGSTIEISVTPAAWPLDIVPPGGTRTTWTPSTPAEEGYFTVTNSGTVSVDVTVSVSHSVPWTAGSSPGADRFVMSWGQTETASVEPTYHVIPSTTPGTSVTTGLGQSESVLLDLEWQAPTSSSDLGEHAIVVTFGAQP